jgi:hypothetical protein
MTAPDRIQITHQPRTMTTPRTALTSDDIPPGPLSEDDLRRGWNQQADEHNQWESLDSCEQLAWAQALAIKADRHAAALKAEPEGEGLTINLQIDASPECLKRLCDGLAAAVKPNGGYRASTLDDLPLGTGGDQMVQVEWWIPEHGCDSLENTLDAIKGRLLVAVRDWWATALVPTPEATPPSPEVVASEVKELVAALQADAECVTAGQPDLMQLTDEQLTRIAEILKAFILGGWIVPTVEQVTPPAPEPVAWCRSDEFANSMNRGGSFSGWKDPGAGANKCDMQLYAIPLPAPQAGEVGA